MNELALFAGAGGGILGGHLLGWRTVCAVEWEPYPASVLAARQNDGLLPPFPIWDDVRTFDGRPWRGVVDVVSGGFPCQDISVAGKGAGITGERSGMWSHMARIVGEVRPRFVFVENSPALLTRGLGVVLSDLAALGYDCRWTVLGASDVGAPHRRERFWLVAHAAGEQHESAPHAQRRQASTQLHTDADCDRMEERLRQNGQQGTGEGRKGRHEAGRVREAMADASRLQPGRQEQRTERERTGAGGESVAAVADSDRVRELQPRRIEREEWRRFGDCGAEVRHTDSKGLEKRQGQPSHARPELAAIERADWWITEPDVGRVADGVAARVDRLKAIGNGQVPLCAAEAWRILTTNTPRARAFEQQGEKAA